MIRRALTPIVSLLAAFAPAIAAEEFRAGVAVADISPTTFPRIIAGGFLEGKGEKLTDRLHARCFVLDDGKTKIAFAIVDTCMMAFLNGVEQPEFSGEAEDTTAGVKDFFLGARSDMFAPLHGFMAHFALFDRALSDAEALSLHTSSGQPKGTPKLADVPFAKAANTRCTLRSSTATTTWSRPL